MKFTLATAFLIHSALSFADYDCSEAESKLKIHTNRNGSIVATYVPTSAGSSKVFYGKSVPLESTVYFEVKQYQLKSADGTPGFLKIAKTPIFTRVPECNGHSRRICDFSGPKVSVSAELDVQGKVTDYVCKKSF